MKLCITVLGKCPTVNSDGNPGTRISYLYADETFEGIATNMIWVPLKYKKPENIIVGETYELTIFCRQMMKFAVRLTLIKNGKEEF